MSAHASPGACFWMLMCCDFMLHTYNIVTLLVKMFPVQMVELNTFIFHSIMQRTLEFSSYLPPYKAEGKSH